MQYKKKSGNIIRQIKNYLPLHLNKIFKIHLYGFFTEKVLYPPPFPFPNPLARGSNSTKILPPGPSGSPLSSQILRVSSSVSLKMRRQKSIFKKTTIRNSGHSDFRVRAQKLFIFSKRGDSIPCNNKPLSNQYLNQTLWTTSKKSQFFF